jgi:hypothetical protein
MNLVYESGPTNPIQLEQSDLRRIHGLSRYYRIIQQKLVQLPLGCRPEQGNLHIYNADYVVGSLSDTVVDSMPNRSWLLGSYTDYSLLDSVLFRRAERKHNWTGPILGWSTFTVSSLMYAGLHLLAWNAAFPTQIQQDLWRVSAITIAVFPLYIVPHVEWSVSKRTRNKWAAVYNPSPPTDKYKRPKEIAFLVIWAIYLGLLVIILPLYVISRAYLIVESVIDVAHLPPGAFGTFKVFYGWLTCANNGERF